MNDVLLNKMITIQRCVNRVTEVYAEAKENLKQNLTAQDSIILNIQRACEACIDIANYLNRSRSLGIPQSSRDSFQLLFDAALISETSNQQMKQMIGFRNIAIHNYQQINLAIVESIIQNRLGDFKDFALQIKKLERG